MIPSESKYTTNKVNKQKHAQKSTKKKKTPVLCYSNVFIISLEHIFQFWDGVSKDTYNRGLQVYYTEQQNKRFMKNRYKDQQTQICQFYKWVKDHARLVDPNYNFSNG